MSTHLTRFNPFNNLSRFDPMREFEDFFSDMRLAPALRTTEMEPRIKLDVMETDKAYTVRAEIPGVKKEDIKVDIDGHQVSITATNAYESEKKEGKTVVRSERYFGQQFRSFTLACEVDEDKSDARYVDGVLELTLPKKTGSTTKKLVVN